MITFPQKIHKKLIFKWNKSYRIPSEHWQKTNVVSTDNTEIWSIIRDYSEELYTNKMDNLEEMDKFLEKYNLPKLNPEEIENIKRPITSMEIKNVIKNLATNKSPWPDGFTGKSYKKFRKELTPFLLKLFLKIAEEGKLPNSFYKASSPWHQNQTKNHKKGKYRAISLINIDAKILSKILQTEYNTLKGSYINNNWALSRNLRILQYIQVNQCDTLY